MNLDDLERLLAEANAARDESSPEWSGRFDALQDALVWQAPRLLALVRAGERLAELNVLIRGGEVMDAAFDDAWADALAAWREVRDGE